MAEKYNNSFQSPEDDFVLVRAESFVATDSVEETVDNDVSSETTSVKADEYIENLLDAELAQAKAEAEAELKTEAKRKKDKAKAREKDKKAQEEANKKHEQDLASEKERLINQEQSRLDIDNRDLTKDNSQSVDNRQDNLYSIEDARLESDLQEASSVPTPFVIPTNDVVPSVENGDNTSKDVQGSYNNSHAESPSPSGFHDEYSERKFKEKRDALYEEHLEQQKLEKEQNEAFREKIQQNAYEKQRASEQYQSFGNEGIDYSGENRHNAYVYTEDAFAKETVISESTYQSIRDTYEKSKAECRSYGSRVPDAVLEQYQQSSDLYFSIERRVHEGTLTVKPEPEAPVYTRKSDQSNFVTSHIYEQDGYKHPQYETEIARTREELRHNDYSASSGYPGPQKPRNVHYNENNDNTASNGFVFSSSPQDRVRRAQDVLLQTQNNEPLAQPKKSFSHAPTSEGISENAETGVRNSNVVSGSQVFAETNKDIRVPKDERPSNNFRKPPDVSTLSKYDKLKIYHSNNYLAPFEHGTRRVVGALSGAFVYAARSEQTGAVNTMVSAQQRARDAANTLRVLKETPRNIAATYYVAKDAAVNARNVVRFFEGKEALAHKSHKSFTIKQLDKQFENPFVGTEKAKINKKFGANANLVDSQINRKIIIKQAQNSALKNEIKRLQAKGAALTADERKQLKALIDKKKAADVNPRKLHGLKKARQEAMKRNRQADRTSERSAKKTIKKTQKKGLKLTKEEKAILARLQERKDLLDKRQKLLKAKDARKQLMTSLSTIITKAASESEDSAIQSILNADRVLQNRYVRSILRFSTKAAMLPLAPVKKIAKVGIKKLDNKLGVSKTVKSAVNTVKEKAVGKVFNSRVYRELNGGLYNRAKKQVLNHTPKKIKTRVKKVSNTIGTINSKRKAVLNKFNSLKKRLANSRLGRAISSVSKGIGNVFSAFNFAKKFLYQIGIYCAGFLIIVAMIGAAISSAGGAVSSLILGESDNSDVYDVEGRIILSPYYDIILKEWELYMEEFKIDGGLKGAEKIVINMDARPSNAREMLSMMAVRMGQELNLGKNNEIKPYLRHLVRQLNPYYEEWSRYYCEGCRIYFVDGKKYYDCPDGHKMVTFNVTPLHFGPQEDLVDPIFTVDEMSNDGQTVISGGLIDYFEITYYCACKDCCGEDAKGKTATGTKPTEGTTIAVDPSVIALGSHVVIDNHEYIAEDTGGAIKGNKIDIFIADHDEALNKGVRSDVPVFAVSYAGTDYDSAGGVWQGWNEGNVEWAKNIYYQDWSDLYSGLPAGTGGGGSTNLRGVLFDENGNRTPRKSIVDIARTEEGSNGDKYYTWWGYKGRVEWCAIFVSWCAAQDSSASVVGKFQNCPAWADDFSKKGRWARPGDITPIAGDIIFFDWNTDGTTDHVGIVIGSDGSYVYTIEGNSGKQPQDRVRVQQYSLKYKGIYGYGIPNYIGILAVPTS